MASEQNDHPVGAIHHEDHHHLVEVSTAAKHLVSKPNTVQSTSTPPPKNTAAVRFYLTILSNKTLFFVAVM